MAAGPRRTHIGEYKDIQNGAASAWEAMQALQGRVHQSAPSLGTHAGPWLMELLLILLLISLELCLLFYRLHATAHAASAR